jgi:hypothetical protein
MATELSRDQLKVRALGSSARDSAEDVVKSDSTDFNEPSILFIGSIAGGDQLVVQAWDSETSVTYTIPAAGYALNRLLVRKVLDATTCTNIIREFNKI